MSEYVVRYSAPWGANVRSQGLLNNLSHSLHFCCSLMAACSAFRRRAIERWMSSSSSVRIELSGLWPNPGKDSTSSPVRRDVDLPSLILTSWAGWPVWLKPPYRPSLSSLQDISISFNVASGGAYGLKSPGDLLPAAIRSLEAVIISAY